MTDQIKTAYSEQQTNYPGALGLPPIRQSVADLLNRVCGLNYASDDVIISSGSRPIIYTLYRTVVDRGEKVVYPVPSWNNEHYAPMVNADVVTVPTTPEQHFMPTAEALEPHLKDAVLLALCSPQNPTGTVFERDNLTQICELVVQENRRRSGNQKPLYVMFDQVYWLLTFGGTEFHHPLSVCPEIEDYAVFVDGMSKAFAGTGIRVGWVTGSRPVVQKMTSLIAHIGAWAPKPEQLAVGRYLADADQVDRYLDSFRSALELRLQRFYDGFVAMKTAGLPVDAIRPMAAIYLSVKIDIQGMRTEQGDVLNDDKAVQEYLMNVAQIGVLPFSWFGARDYANWFRISVGTCHEDDIPIMLSSLESALKRLSPE